MFANLIQALTLEFLQFERIHFEIITNDRIIEQIPMKIQKILKLFLSYC